MSRKRTAPTAWINQIFDSSKVARRGGPVRRRLPSLDRNTSRASVIAEALRRGWIVTQIGDEWFFYDAGLTARTIVSRFDIAAAGR
ncbi:hypothetical protein [Sphingomonas sp. TZW2008]|uniref:hypothetical protein n=1 Tax=Sphingomonas sp. TZW2008 TaxID=1917973 RepID=UPI001181998E|nr:hypothetical protein [Sphingomonas sp. TZW2008]